MLSNQLAVLDSQRLIRLTRPGRLLPFLGLALRGLSARPFKASVCQYSPEEQNTTRLKCVGCPQMAGCPYGELFEPDPPADVKVFAGQNDAVRPFVIEPSFPLPLAVPKGFSFRVRMVFAGEQAIGHAERFWNALAAAGAKPDTGLRPLRTTFRIEDTPEGDQTWQVNVLDLPPDMPPMLPFVRIRLTTPLMLRASGKVDRQRSILTRPQFIDVLRGCLNTIGGLFRLYAGALPDEVFRTLRELGEKIAIERQELKPFDQVHVSTRGQSEGRLRGVTGWMIFRDVPREIYPWVVWGGRLHTGVYRIAGAGGWHTEWSQTS